MLINHSDKAITDICKANGDPLWGERSMYERIVKDCNLSPLTWHMFYDAHLPLPINGKPEIQIDFFLICPLGIIIIEVKGGQIEIRDGKYINYGEGRSRVLKPSPFSQVDAYKWALFNNHVLNMDEVFISTACAFPSATLDRTSDVEVMNESYKLWTAIQHNSADESFADFCISVLRADRDKASWAHDDLSEREMNQLKAKFAPTIKAAGSFTPSSVQEILDWLKVSDIDALDSLSKNNRIVIEGGPGTGKTTIAKAYISKYSNQNGIYLCWNQLLAAKMKHLLKQKGLVSCDVDRVESFLIRISKGLLSHNDFEGRTPDLSKVRDVLENYKDSSENPNYSYIIIDEIHDTLDKGAIEILDTLSSIGGDGLSFGRFLVFFDGHQGYDSSNRNLESLASIVSKNAAVFTLTKNRRVPSNREIVDISNIIRDSESYEDLKSTFDEIEAQSESPIRIKHFTKAMDMLTEISRLSQEIHTNQKGEQYVLLVHSNISKLVCLGAMSFHDVLLGMNSTMMCLSEGNINSPNTAMLPWTSILRFKGLERNNVILAFSREDIVNCFELFIGMSRAIVSVNLLILD